MNVCGLQKLLHNLFFAWATLLNNAKRLQKEDSEQSTIPFGVQERAHIDVAEPNLEIVLLASKDNDLRIQAALIVWSGPARSREMRNGMSKLRQNRRYIGGSMTKSSLTPRQFALRTLPTRRLSGASKTMTPSEITPKQ